MRTALIAFVLVLPLMSGVMSVALSGEAAKSYATVLASR